jgi:hypothetical protein
LFRPAERVGEGPQEGFESAEGPPHEAGRDLGVFQQLVQADAKPSLHGFLLSAGSPRREKLYANDLRPIS